MKKIILLTLGAAALGSVATVQAESASFSMGMEIPKACSFTSLNSGPMALSLSSGSFLQVIPLGQSSCNAATDWKFTSANGGLVAPTTANGFLSSIPYTATIDLSPADSGSSDNVGFTSDTSSGDIVSAGPFSGNLEMILAETGSVVPASFVAGTYTDTLTIDITFQ